VNAGRSEADVTRRIIVDTDIGTDVDDALALAFALRHPEIDVVAVTTVSGDTGLRARIAAKLLQLDEQAGIEMAAGVREPIGGKGRMLWFGHEGKGIIGEGEELSISQRDAVEVIVESLMAEEKEVVTLGPLSNVAVALAREPRIAQRIIRLTVMGGFFHRCELNGQVIPPAVDYNLNADPEAAVRVLSLPIPTCYVPADVTMRTRLLEKHLRRMENEGDVLVQALSRLVRIWTPVMAQVFGRAGLKLAPDVVAIPHDPLAVATVVDRRFVTVKKLLCTVAVVGGFVRTFIDPAAGRQVEVVTDVDADAFADYFLQTLGVG
jgi:purine nucleosidase